MATTQEELAKVAGTRVRITVLSTGKFLSAVVKTIDAEDSLFLLNVPATIGDNEPVIFEIHGPDKRILGSGTVSTTNALGTHCRNNGDFRFVNCTEPARIATELFLANMQDMDGPLKGMVLDISKAGVSIAVSRSVTVRSVVRMEIKGPGSTLQVHGTVQYCREMQDGMGSYRIGIKLGQNDRITTGKWLNQFNSLVSRRESA